jgi:hypothetical protein
MNNKNGREITKSHVARMNWLVIYTNAVHERETADSLAENLDSEK